jgi:hypothetical protein
MLGSQVSSDLDLDTVNSVVPLQTSWGQKYFHIGLTDITSDAKVIKRKQLPIMALRIEPTVCKNIVKSLETLKDRTSCIDDALENTDNRISESVSQILWKPTHFGAFINKIPYAMNALILWRTIILPAFAVLAPLIAVVIPFFLLRFLHPELQFSTDEYMSRVKQVLLQQITIPAFLKSRHEGDRLGFLFESLFIGLTLAMFISGIWSQITNAIHTRTIWFDLEERGKHIQSMYSVAKETLATLKKLSPKAQRAAVHLIDSGEAAVLGCKEIETLDGVSTFGYVWNNSESIKILKVWLSKLDCYSAIASLDNICFPTIGKTVGIKLTGVYHPFVKGCISNNLITESHSILTGPNRGGKSTYCKAVGLAVVTAQSWGFAWASRMSFSPFSTIVTALEPAGLLGSLSTFEAEIEFAKSVLATEGLPAFVMMDEIFHSTNAGDGLEASRVFMRQLYTKVGIVSIISTHYKDLAESFKDVAAAIQMEASIDEKEGDRLVYTYKVTPGISDKSSVMEILRERGLLPVA